MGNINELESRIKSVNANIAKLNSERNSNLARKKVYEEEFNKGCAEYNAKYGTSIDLSNIKEEYSRVQDYFTTKVGEMEQVIALVKEGRVAEAEAILKGVPEVEEQLPVEEPQVEETPQVETVQKEVSQTEASQVGVPQVEAPQAQGTQAPPVAPTLVETPTPTVENIPQAQTPVAPVAPQPQVKVPVAPQPTAPTQGTVMEDDIMPRPTHPLFSNAVPPVAPTAPKAPTAPVAPTVPTASKAPTPVAPQPTATEVKIPTPVGVPSKPFTASEPLDPVGVGTVTSDIGAFDEILRQERNSAVYTQNVEVPIGAVPTPPIGAAPTVPTAPTVATASSQPIGAAPKPPVGAVPTPPPFPASFQGTEDEVSSALNFGDILSGTDFM